MITNSSIVESVQLIQLDGFIRMHIQRQGIAFVVDNYCPIREQYYAQKYPQQQNTVWRESDHVQCSTEENQ